MAYGITIKNKNEDVLIGTRNFNIRFAFSGSTRPEFQTGSSVGDSVSNSHSISLNGLVCSKTIIFARPYAVNVQSSIETPDQVLQRCCPVFGLKFIENGSNAPTNFKFVAPLKNVDLNPSGEDRENNTSYKTWGTSDTNGQVRIYYEVWTIENSDEESGDYGFMVKDGSDVIYSSNRKQFRPEKVSVARPRITVNTGNNTVGNSHAITLEMDDISNLAQREYLAFMNGTCHMTGAVFGQNSSSATNMAVPNDGRALYSSMTVWNYYDQEDIFLRKPSVQWKALQYRTETYTSAALDSDGVRYITQGGIPTLAMIGVVK